ncbi:Uncharacterised protein [Vibrio cholerae]|nr:Uncharacterised protein [Vibrio cholerae]
MIKRKRASSSSSANGLPMYSSAPPSNPLTRSLISSRAVSIMTGNV